MFFLYIPVRTKETKRFSELPQLKASICWLYVQNFTPTELENVLDSYFEHTWWTNISSLLSSLRRRAKQTKIRTCVVKLENANQPSVALKSENENLAVLSSSTRRNQHTQAYFKHLLTGKNSTNVLEKHNQRKGNRINKTKEKTPVLTNLLIKP